MIGSFCKYESLAFFRQKLDNRHLRVLYLHNLIIENTVRISQQCSYQFISFNKLYYAKHVLVVWSKIWHHYIMQIQQNNNLFSIKSNA